MPSLNGRDLDPRGKPMRRCFENLRSTMAVKRITRRRVPLMAGGHDVETGDGLAFGQSGMNCPWMWERTITRGQWAGGWRRVRWDQAGETGGPEVTLGVSSGNRLALPHAIR